MLGAAIGTITAALIFYTWGVFSERRLHTLKAGSLILFWLGLACDTAGTCVMSLIAKESQGAGNPVHAVTGMIAIILMLFHAIWATYVLLKGSEKAKANFSKFSIVVWAIWLIPYFIGMFMGMR